MKRNMLLAAVLLMCAVSVLSAAELESESEYYYINVPVVKVLQHQDGYVVIYRQAGYKIGSTVIPMKWFKAPENKAQLGYIDKALGPYLTVYYKGPDIERIKLNVPPRRDDPVWGIVPNDSDTAGKFDIDTFSIEY